MLASVLLGCAPAPSPSPPMTAPPIPADFVPWPDIVWQVAHLQPRPPGVSAERVVSVTATDAAIVAVGYRETNEVRDGIAWRSTDGDAWDVIDSPAFDGVELVDVAPAPNGFVALGVADTPDDVDHPTTVVFSSVDGSSWLRLPPLPATGDSSASSIAGGPAGVIALADAADGGQVVWRATDGRSFERVTLAGPAASGLIDPHGVSDGFVALTGSRGSPAMLRSKDGSTWTASPVEPASKVGVTRLTMARWGTIVQGMGAPGCAAPCPAGFFAWWSGDGVRWGALPAESPLTNGASIVVPAGDHGLLAIDGADAWSSPDGWAWRSLPEPGDGSVTIDDAVVRGDLIVAVGEEAEDDGSSVGRILVAGVAR
jgi:hypothetical protein